MRNAAQLFSTLRDEPGVYLLVDLDDKPLYAGKSEKIRKRMRQHFVSQNSSVTSDGLLDLFEVLRVHVWYCDSMRLDACETALHHQFAPSWNRAPARSEEDMNHSTLQGSADVVIDLIQSPEELALRREPLERIEAKLLHLVRGVRKAKISGTSPGIDRALYLHAEELVELFSERP
jgi:hypothetical protein